MWNTTINYAGLVNKTAFEQQQIVAGHPNFLVPLVVSFVVPVLIFFFYGLVVGKPKVLVTRANFWLLFTVFIVQFGLLSLVVFPVYYLWF